MKTIANFLAGKGPQFNTIEVGNTVIDALSIMKTEETSFVIVTCNGKFKGIVTERDFAHKVILMNRSSRDTKVEDIMSDSLPTVSSNDSVDKCMMLMNSYKTRQLPVFDDFEFKGVVSINDLIVISMASTEYGGYIKSSSEKVF